MRDDIPTSTVSDRNHLEMEYEDYHDLAEAVSKNCIRDRFKNHMPIRKLKIRKIHNMRNRIIKSEKLSKSLIFKEMLRQLNQELSKRKKMKGMDRRIPS
ncbi:hypothetical protein SUFG_00059 [Sulfitobacter phage phiCB2047-B]|uniref:Uncharacterized protein n=1 Tax=Sulfitobacter phage phiCB2047-B TaxID=754046 RepID=M4PRP9_9CAUD|nr:hypothetical protein SUFG_00059 [Sulfitobacter phage phiCB2047-B]AGH07426.1 hypothetical protein SUFG_00059 [Sulfitobacter phage phiCB2047-B]